ncbi:MAG TPA: glutamate--tRNA ligase [Hyphomicrobiaceae bacterium]|nr:glutamate--tRNA ligase [Hyphomicrobiaceae bacterium]
MTTPVPSNRKVVTRFAPSPTGLLHIGGARTALFNWLYAKHTGGTFLLRIEDTDRERSKPEHVDAITNGLKWLELDWDGDPLFQFARVQRHRDVALGLLASGGAYNCYLTAEELTAMREKAKAEGRPQVIESPWRDRDPKEAPAGVKPSVRLRTRRDGETVVDDKVQGRVVIPNKDLDDMIILRSDGTPTYNFAVVVDDHDMGITHVIRGVDHLTNAARQTQVYVALGWDVPVFAHVPLIHGPDGAKLSKRHGAEATDAYRAMGYLPEAMRNYLVRLGWSHGDDEIISTEQLIEWFDLDAVGRSPARFDFAKLADLNGHYIRKASDDELVRRLKELLAVIDGGPEKLAKLDRDGGWNRLRIALPGLKERAKTLLELIDGAAFLFAERPLPLDEKAAKLMDTEAKATLAALVPRLEAAPEWTAAALEAEVRSFAEATGAKLGKVAQPLRAALTGRSVSPPVFDVMHALGREETIARLGDQTR